jgi:hypothetical protein
MSDALLSEMSRAAREHALADPRWADFAAGALSDADREDLLAKARAAGLDEDTIAAFGPRDDAFDDSLADAALAAMKAPRSSAEPPHAAAPNEGAATASNEHAGAQVLPFRRRAPVVVGAAALLAAAAAALLWLPRAAQMPEYTMSVEGGRHAQRSSPDDPGGVVELVPGNRVVLTLRPDAPAPGKVSARAYLLGPSPVPERRVPVEVAESGAVRIALPAEQLFQGVPSGAWDLCVAVGDPSRLPPATVSEPPPARGAGFVTACRRVTWTAP